MKGSGALKQRPARGGAARTGAVGRSAVTPALVQALRVPPLVAPLGMALAALAFAAFQIAHLTGYGYTSAAWLGHWSDYDEGVYLVSARSLVNGHALFSDVFSSQPALFLPVLALFVRLPVDLATAGHLYTLVCGLLALLGVAWICWEAVGCWSALLAVALLAVSPGFVIATHAVEAEAPMMAFGSLAVAAAVRYARLADRRWLALAALLVAAATLSKLLAVSLLAPLAVAIVLCAASERERSFTRRALQDGALAGACLGLPILAAFALIAPADQYDQVVRFHLQASKILADTVSENGAYWRTFLGWDLGLAAMIISGLAAAAVARRPLVIIPAVWALATAAGMARYAPLFVHHLTVLLPPFAALAGCSFALFDTSRRGYVRGCALLLLLLSGALPYGLWLPATLRHTGHVFVRVHDPVAQAQIAWLRANSRSGDLVVVDNQVLAAAAGRVVPGPLCDTSIVRGTVGYLPLSLLERASDPAHVDAVLLTRQLAATPPYVAWLRRHFKQVYPPGVAGLAFVRSA